MSETHDLSGHLALVVDDDPRTRVYIRSVLKRAGVQVVEAADGIEALEVFHASRSKIDLVITDIRMPRMSGTDLAIRLRSDCPAIPLIFVSGEPAPADICHPRNRACFLEKPFAPKDLLDAARQFLDSIPVAC
jgi:two-component system cell cycle sensor histidine kinase/response regulator CckA